MKRLWCFSNSKVYFWSPYLNSRQIFLYKLWMVTKEKAILKRIHSPKCKTFHSRLHDQGQNRFLRTNIWLNTVQYFEHRNRFIFLALSWPVEEMLLNLQSTFIKHLFLLGKRKHYYRIKNSYGMLILEYVSIGGMLFYNYLVPSCDSSWFSQIWQQIFMSRFHFSLTTAVCTIFPGRLAADNCYYAIMDGF